ncbi:MAG TPA: hypothetical protein VFQ63_01515 [Patescibacteria group bacterium]|nr:hypothetical protein [Patescibacteria group bacterium]
MKKIIFTAILLFILPLTIQKTWAQQNTNPTTPIHASPTPQNDPQINALKQKADTLITNRITQLNTLLTHLSQLNLSDSDRASFTNSIQDTITSLNQLKAKIDGESDLTALQEDTKSIVTVYKIYTYFEPRIRLTIAIKTLSQITQRLTVVANDLSTTVSYLQSQGKDTTAFEKALTDINFNLTQIDSTLHFDQNTINNITISSASQTSFSSIFTQIRKDLATIQERFAAIRQDFSTIQAILNAPNTTTTINGTITPKPTLTCYPRPSCLDGTPRCMIAQPIGGWCSPTISPRQ